MGENILEFLRNNIIAAAVLGLIVALILGPIIIPALRRLKFGQNIREEGPKSHLKKAGTPTIGGIIFLLSTTLVVLLMGYDFNDEAMIALYSMLAFGFIGFLDDLLKIIKKQNEGLKAYQKMILLVVFSLAIAVYGYYNLDTSLSVPFFDIEWSLGILYIPFVVFYFAAVTNAVNFTDGLDGLATSVTILVLTFFGVVAYVLGYGSLAIFIAILIGGLFGFLKFNAYPAKVFMGDTGSLALGGVVGAVALIMGEPFLVVIVGGIYVFEVVSVILQVASFKLRGKRIFKMAPVHHHFEQLGWSEIKIVTIFSIITIILCVIGFLAL
ncbi:MAG: phospho-N-acetylmuramoyl-pentapeptide-transferase [Clostridium sp.]